MTKPALGGIKISSELVLLKLFFADSDGSVPDLCRLFSEHRINLPFISLSRTDNAARASVCVEAGDEAAVMALIDGDDYLKTCCRLIPRVGVISIYPAKSSFELLGRSLMVLAQAGIRLHGWASSLSSLAFLCDFREIPKAVTAFEKHMELPSNKAPLVSDIQVRQSNAVKNE